MTNESIGEWEELKIDNDYLIFNQYPYPIRRKNSDRLIKESIVDNGYVMCSLNGKRYFKHRIVAQQWLENDEPELKVQIDHVNHNRADNRLTNLRWVSASENQMNKTGYGGHRYVFYDELPETAEPLEMYNDHEFDDLWIDYETQKLIYFQGVKYRELRLLHHCRSKGYWATDRNNGKQVWLSHIKLFN